jgi:uncharacterized membrane protein
MRDFRIAVEIKAPPDQVWAVMRDVERWPEWTPSVKKVRLLAGPLAVGRRALIWQPNLPRATWEVTELDDRQRNFTWVTRSPGVLVNGRHAVERTEQGSRAMLSIHFSGLLGGLSGWLTQNLNERYLAMEANGLKECSEGLAIFTSERRPSVTS